MTAFFSSMAWRAILSPLSKLHSRLDSLWSLSGLQDIPVATREESGVFSFPSRRGLTPRVYFLPKWPMDSLVITISNVPQYLFVPDIGSGFYNSNPWEVTLLSSCSWACEGLGQDFSSIFQGLWLEALTYGFRGCSKPALLSWIPLPLSLP